MSIAPIAVINPVEIYSINNIIKRCCSHWYWVIYHNSINRSNRQNNIITRK